MQVLTLLIAITLSLVPPSHPQAQSTLRSVLISMTRESDGLWVLPDRRALGQSPSYSISIAGDGTVTYVGSAGVRTLGKRTHKIKPEAVAALVTEFEQAGFWSLADRYDHVELGGGLAEFVSDLPSATVVLSLAGKSKSVYDYYGTPAVVRKLEDRVDEVADSRRYTGRPPNKRLAPKADVVNKLD